MGAWYHHGGNVDAARLRYPDAPEPWVDLSTGINPHGWDAGRVGPIDWASLPSPAASAALEQAAADHFGVAADRVCAVPGSEVGLRLLESLGLPGPQRYLAPGYGTYAEALPGGAPFALRELEAASEAAGTLLLARPNNPDGLIVAAERLASAAARLRETRGVLVIDEAFADVLDQPSVAALLGEEVIALRSYGKFFGLAGLRLGFVIAAPERLALLRRRLGSWPVNSAAIAIGTAAYRDEAWIAAMRLRLTADAARLDAMLRRHGLDASGDCPLFRLVEVEDAAGLFDRLAHKGILTRPFAYAPTWLRLGLPGSEEAFQRLDAALGDG